jgi:DNA-binding transcriptional ArsR family regulator
MSPTDAVQRSRCDSLEIARDKQRRAVLRYLSRERSPVDFAALVEHVAARGTGASETVSDGCRTVRLSLAHVHLPMLEDAGLVRYDRDAGRVSLADGVENRLAAARRELRGVVADLPAGGE